MSEWVERMAKWRNPDAKINRINSKVDAEKRRQKRLEQMPGSYNYDTGKYEKLAKLPRGVKRKKNKARKWYQLI